VTETVASAPLVSGAEGESPPPAQAESAHTPTNGKTRTFQTLVMPITSGKTEKQSSEPRIKVPGYRKLESFGIINNEPNKQLLFVR
jgi:hypothetical protein